MKTAKKYFLCFCFLFWGILNFHAQQGLVASGGENFGTGGSMSFSIGQIDYLTVASFGGTILTEGLQQPYKFLIIEDTDINLNIFVYPTLATDFVILNVQNLNLVNMTYLLFNDQGKLIEKQTINSIQTTISLLNLANAMYFIRVFENNDELKTFKIIKN